MQRSRLSRVAAVFFAALAALAQPVADAGPPRPAPRPSLRVRVRPPAVRVEMRPRAPGIHHVWLPGYWAWRGGTHVWIGGTWLLPPWPGMVWIGPEWVRDGDEWGYRDGYWTTPGQQPATPAPMSGAPPQAPAPPPPALEAPVYLWGQEPAPLAPFAAAARKATDALRERLLARLTAELARGGAVAAIRVCRDEAPVLTATVAREQGLAIGRTSARLRNPANTPRDWARFLVASAAGRKAADTPAIVVDLGDRVGTLTPIAMGAPCLTCHGPRAGIAPEVARLLAADYPGDAAVDFTEGDLRGFFWTEARR